MTPHTIYYKKKLQLYLKKSNFAILNKDNLILGYLQSRSKKSLRGVFFINCSKLFQIQNWSLYVHVYNYQ